MQLAYAGIIAAFLYSFFAVLPVETFTIDRIVDVVANLLRVILT